MSKVTVAAVQMTYGLENAMEKVREAASQGAQIILCLLYTSPSPRDLRVSRMPSSA